MRGKPICEGVQLWAGGCLRGPLTLSECVEVAQQSVLGGVAEIGKAGRGKSRRRDEVVYFPVEVPGGARYDGVGQRKR